MMTRGTLQGAHRGESVAGDTCRDAQPTWESCGLDGWEDARPTCGAGPGGDGWLEARASSRQGLCINCIECT
jgi:hypothetical protein